MTTEDTIIHIFCLVDDEMKAMPKHRQAKLYPSELVTIGLLFALKGGHFWAFYRWLKRDYDSLFAGLPERTRLQRLLQTHQDWYHQLLAAPSFFTVIDSYPIELLFPIRQGRSPQQVGKKGKDKGRWTVGIKLCWLLILTPMYNCARIKLTAPRDGCKLWSMSVIIPAGGSHDQEQDREVRRIGAG